MYYTKYNKWMLSYHSIIYHYIVRDRGRRKTMNYIMTCYIIIICVNYPRVSVLLLFYGEDDILLYYFSLLSTVTLCTFACYYNIMCKCNVAPYVLCISHALLFRIGVIGQFAQCNAPTRILNFLHTYCTRAFYCKHCIYTKITQYNNIIMTIVVLRFSISNEPPSMPIAHTWIVFRLYAQRTHTHIVFKM